MYVGIDNEYIPYGTFLIEKTDNKEVVEQTKFVGYDNMIKFNKLYEDNNTYPISLKEYLRNLCTQVGIELGSTTLVNENYQVLGNSYTNNEDCKTVLSAIAQLCGGFAKIGRDNKLYIVNLNQSDVVDTIDGNNYNSSFAKNNMYGEVNSLIIRLSNVEGENTVRENAQSIATNGLTEITIADNYILTDSTQRSLVIDAIWNKLKGLKYLPFKTDYYGYPYLDAGDKINILDNNDTAYETYVLNHTFTFNGAFSGKIEANALTKTQTAYKNIKDIKTQFKNVEFIVDKQNQKIEGVLSDVSEQSTKITQLELKQGNITSKVEAVENDIDKVEGSVSNLDSKIDSEVSGLEDKINDEISNLQSQIDGQIQFWNGETIPTINNYPATQWTTEEQRNNHRADIYTVIEDVDGELKQGKSYRFDKVGSDWVWVELTDNELSAVQALAQSKAKVFTTTPKPPYSIGDLWIKDQELYECKVAKDSSGTYNQSDWQKATKYTDDTVANLANLTANTALDGVRNITDTQATLEGTEIRIDDGAEEPIIKLEVDGYSTQATRNGLNKFDLDAVSWSTDKYSRLETGFKITNAWATSMMGTENLLKIFKPNTTYTIRVKSKILSKPTNVKENNNNLLALYRPNGHALGGFLKTVAYTSKAINELNKEYINIGSFTTPQDMTDVNLLTYSYYGNNDGSTTYSGIGEIEVYDIMMVEGTYSSENFPEYEQYGATPSLEFSSEIKSIADDINLWDLPYVFELTKQQEFVRDILAGTYTLNAEDIVSDYNDKWTSLIVFYYEDGTNKSIYIGGTQNKTQTTTFDKKVVRYIIYSNSDWNTSQETTTIFKGFKIQKGTKATPYSEYGKGTLNIRRIGKNLFKNSSTLAETTYSGELDKKVLHNGDYSIKTITAWKGIYVDLKKICEENNLKIGDIITHSIYFTTNFLPTKNMLFTLYRVRGSAGYAQTSVPQQEIKVGEWNRVSFTFEVNEYTLTTTQARIECDYWDSSDPYYFGNNRTNYVWFASPQVEKGALTDYANSVFDTYTLKIPPLKGKDNATKDTIETDGIHRRLKTIVLNGTEVWTNNQTTNEYISFYLSTATYGKIDYLYFCSHFKQIKIWQEISELEEENFWYHAESSWGIKILKSRLSTPDTAGFKKWLSENNIEIVIKAQEEVIEPFDDEQQTVIDSISTMLDTHYFICDANMRITYVRNNGLSDMYETKSSVIRRFAQQDIKLTETGASIESLVSVTNKLNEGFKLADAELQKELEKLGQNLSDLQSTTSTSFTQTESNFEMKFNEIISKMNENANETSEEFKKIVKYIRFDNGNIILGEEGNQLILKIQNDRISYQQNGSEVAYFSNNKLYVTTLEVTHSFQIGNFIFIPRENGNLSFKKVGGN